MITGQLAVKLGYSINLDVARKNEKQLRLGRTQGSAPVFSYNPQKYPQVVEIIKAVSCFSGLSTIVINAHKCSRKHQNVGIGGGKIGVFPISQILNVRTLGADPSLSSFSHKSPSKITSLKSGSGDSYGT